MISPGRIAFTIFNIDIAWYGILIGIGFLLAFLIAYKRCNLHNIDQDHFLTFIVWLLPTMVIGARAYYVIFTWDYYKNHLDQILNIRGGGLAIHGGIIVGIIVCLIVTKHYKENPIDLMDLCFTVVPLGQAIGRWGNFFNEEAHGIETTLPIYVDINGIHYHATFLYESVWCLLLFIFLMWFDTKKRKYRGQTSLLYVLLYSFERFFVEGLRTDSLMIGNIRQAQLLSLCAFVASILLLIIFNKKNKNKEIE